MGTLLGQALIETSLMVLASGALGFAAGLPLGVLLYATSPGRLCAHRGIHLAVGSLVNLGRSFPFVILLVFTIPFTRWLVGSSIGTLAAIVPLSVSATPFAARLVEGALQEVSPDLVEAARILGADTWRIVWRVLLPDALPGIVQAAATTLVTLVGYSAMAGVVGGGGLGDVGIRYGYQRFDPVVMGLVVLILLVLVQLIQWAGDLVASSVRQRR